MPIYEYSCEDCGGVFESIEVWSTHVAVSCKLCNSPKIRRIIGSGAHIRMDSTTVLHNLPDPSPPLEELRGKNKPGCAGGYQDKPYADTNLKNYERHKDKQGNTIWKEKRRTYIDLGKEKKS